MQKKKQVETSLSPKYFLLTIPMRYFFCGSFSVVFVFAILSCLCLAALRYLLEKGWPLGSPANVTLYCVLPLSHAVF